MKKTTCLFSLVGVLMLLGPVTGFGPVAQAGNSDHFDIFMRHLDEGVEMGRYRFDVPQWEFGDRAGYRCAWAFLTSGGQRVARVQFDRGQTYTQVNDAFGVENNNDFSQCLPEDQETEVKSKPTGLGDTIVDFRMGGATVWSMTFPATSPTDSDTWWEVEEADSGEVELEMYWRTEVAAIATLSSLAEGQLTFSVRSTSSPVISSFSPSSGGAGTSVDILGANFTGATNVAFNGTPAAFSLESSGEISATVPSGATTGLITVTTPAGTASSAASFTVGASLTHQSSVSLRLSGHLIASGTVRTPDGAAQCLAGRTVDVQRSVNSGWNTVGSDVTGNAGSYRIHLNDREGRYRAVVRRATLANGETCLNAVSPRRAY
jgi:hypothetical protein